MSNNQESLNRHEDGMDYKSVGGSSTRDSRVQERLPEAYVEADLMQVVNGHVGTLDHFGRRIINSSILD